MKYVMKGKKMNRLLSSTAIAAVLAITHPAYADSWKDAPHPVEDWTGVYAGFHVGAAIPRFDNRWNPGISCDEGEGEADPRCGQAVDDVDRPGALVGAVIGYNRQVDTFVYGIELDASAVLLRNNTYYYDFDGEVDNSERSELHIDALVSARLRAGFLYGDKLFYATAGIGYVSAEFSASTSDSNPRMGIQSLSKFAPVLGGGMEYRVSPDWTIDLNVQHYFVNEDKFTGGLGDGETEGSSVDFSGLTTVNLGFRHKF